MRNPMAIAALGEIGTSSARRQAVSAAEICEMWPESFRVKDGLGIFVWVISSLKSTVPSTALSTIFYRRRHHFGKNKCIPSSQIRHHPYLTMTTPPPDLTALNRAFFDDLAAKYDIQPWQKQISLQITTFIQQNLSFINIPKHPNTTLLDYACGTGTLSRALGPYIITIQPLDLSPKMVSRYNELASTSEIPSVRNSRAIEGNLLTDSKPAAEFNGPEYHNFDIAAVGGGLHHFDDPTKAIARLAQRLKVGGVLLIVDFVEEAAQEWVPTSADPTIHKRGFCESEMREMMERCGLGDFGWKEMPERLEMKFSEHTVLKRGFLARAVKRYLGS